MSNDQPEHGLTLGRLVAAERNAVTAATGVKELRKENAELQQRIEKLEALVAQLTQEHQQAQSRMMAMHGGTVGATA